MVFKSRFVTWNIHKTPVACDNLHLQFVVLMRLFAIELLFRLVRFHRVADGVDCCFIFCFGVFVAVE